MKKQILIDRTEKTRICREFKVSNVTLWKALTFQSDSSTAMMLRKVALERGGKVGGAGTVTECETTFQTAAETMTQVFSPRVKIVVYFKTGHTVVLVDEEVKMKSENLTIPEFMNLQAQVQEIASTL